MQLSSKVLVIGSDGVIGSALMSALSQGGAQVIGSSRRPDSNRLLLDLSGPIPYNLLPNVNTVFICAGINGFAACDADPALASRVNVEATVAIGAHYLKRAAHVVFLSSTSVFGSRHDAPDEYSTLSPNTSYGAFKCAAEISLQTIAREAPGALSIVRLTKVLFAQMPLLTKWRISARGGVPLEAHFDSMVCPISLSYVMQSLQAIARLGAAGCFHLTGAQTLSYATLASTLVELGAIPQAVVRKSSQENPLTSAVQRQCVSLTMATTTKGLGIDAQRIEDCLLSL